MSEFRWLLLAAGILVLAVVFWWSRREASGKPVVPSALLGRRAPGLAWPTDDKSAPAVEADRAPSEPAFDGRIIAIRLMGQGSSTIAGEALLLALREAGLRHGKFGIFHRHDPRDDGRILFSVASILEPGSFDLQKIQAERLPGISIFLMIPGPGDCVAAFDDMMSTSRQLVGKLGGELLDEHGSRLSVQRERYLREEVIQYQHKTAPP